MRLASGKRLGPYEVLALIGAGGMGEVYRARDTRLDRYVAIKVLPDDDRFNDERGARFEREARAISKLNHPHICTLYDVGVEGSIRFLVMELVEGQPLDARLGAGRLPSAEALTCAAQILDALECAHQHGIVHRDLKPGNIILTTSGVKLLDFGVAKWLDREDSLLDQSPHPEQTLTAGGQIVGTLPYMAPEQLEGGESDARTDIFAFGVIVYEMLSGAKPFDAGSRAGLVAAVLEHAPRPLGSYELPVDAAIPPALERIVHKCLAKSPNDRWQTVRDLRDEFRWIVTGETQQPHAAPRRHRGRWLLASAGAALLVVTALVVAAVANRNPPPLTRFAVDAPSIYSLGTELALSPQGRSVVFTVVGADRIRRLALHTFDSLEGRILPDTHHAEQPFWSPDGRAIGFFAERTLKVLPLSAQTARRLAHVEQPSGAAWGPDGTILFAPQRNGVLYTISSAGGVAAPLTRLAADETAHIHPRFLDDDGNFIFTTGGARRIVASALDSTARTNILTIADLSPTAIAGEFIVYMRSGAVVAQRLNRARTGVVGGPMLLTEHIAAAIAGALNGAWFDAKGSTLAVLRPAVAGREFVWVDRRGQLIEIIEAAADMSNPDLSPDGTQLVATKRELDIDRQTLRLIDLDVPHKSVDLGPGGLAAWSPDGQSIAFGLRSPETSLPSLLLRRLTTNSVDRLATDIASRNANVHGWSPDGRFVIYSAVDERTNWDIWMLPVTGDRRPRALLQSPAAEAWAAVSPDGRWLAYCSNESGSPEVYVRRFPDGGEPRRISDNGGTEPRWRRDGRELFYVRSNEIVGVPVTSSDPWVAGPPAPLFSTELSTTSDRTHYVPSPDGRRFLLVRPRVNTVKPRIEIVQHWQGLLDRQ